MVTVGFVTSTLTLHYYVSGVSKHQFGKKTQTEQLIIIIMQSHLCNQRITIHWTILYLQSDLYSEYWKLFYGAGLKVSSRNIYSNFLCGLPCNSRLLI